MITWIPGCSTLSNLFNLLHHRRNMDYKVNKHEFGVVQRFWIWSNHCMTQVTRCVEECNWWFNPTKPFQSLLQYYRGNKAHEFGGGPTLPNLFDQIWLPNLVPWTNFRRDHDRLAPIISTCPHPSTKCWFMKTSNLIAVALLEYY